MHKAIFILSMGWLASCGDGAAVVYVGEGSDSGPAADTETVTDSEPATDSETATDSAVSSDSESSSDTCALLADQRFDQATLPVGWTVSGAAAHVYEAGVGSGLIELTAAAPDVNGSVFLTSHRLAGGDMDLSFSFYTGPSNMDGGDGFSLSVFNVDDMAAIFPLLNAAVPGMTLGYGIFDVWTGDAFHVEFDTYYNQAQFGESHTDPVDSDHVGVMRNGDQTAHLLLGVIADVEDATWHEVVVQTAGERVTVTLDSVPVVDEVIAGFAFSGGYMGFTASSGGNVNLHRIDNVIFNEMCFF